MAIKKRSTIANQANTLADQIADKPYGKHNKSERVVGDEYITTSISIPQSMLQQLEDLALINKRSMNGPKNVSALIRSAVTTYFAKG